MANFFHSFWTLDLKEFKFEGENINNAGEVAHLILDNTSKYIEVPTTYLNKMVKNSKLLKDSFILHDSILEPNKCPNTISKCLISEKSCNEFFEDSNFG